MKVIVKGAFERDIKKISNKKLLIAIDQKIIQIEKAIDLSKITSLKKLTGYTHQYRIAVKADKLSYRMGVVIRGNNCWLVRVLPRRIIYKRFP